MYSVLAVLFFMCAAGCVRNAKDAVSFSSLMGDMTNLNSFAYAPLGKSGLVSSYDRTGGNSDWADFSAATNGGIILIADLKGPGVVRRIWQTNVPKGDWIFFFDGEKKPGLVLSKEMRSRAGSPFRVPLYVGESGGTCSYVPLPYKKSLRIAIDIEGKVPANSRPYYQINYETFPDGTDVRTFRSTVCDTERELIDSVCNNWLDLPSAFPPGERPDADSRFMIKSGTSRRVMDETGPGTVKYLAFKIRGIHSSGALARARLLREIWLRVYWEDSSKASVTIPLGDFFCNGLARRRLRTLPIRVGPEWFESLFPMPFRKSARIEVVNYSGGDIELNVKASVDRAPLHEPVRWFHARWNQSSKSGNPFQLLQTSGKGHFAGCYLISLGMDGSWNILEGDDLFEVDGSSKLYGTGLEDYFNGGWYYFGLFERPLHGLIEKAAMRTSQYRFHLTTPVAFEKSLRCTFEFGAGNSARGYMSSAAFWYQDPPVSAGTDADSDKKNWWPAIDKVGVLSMMAELFELERKGFLEECVERSEYFAEAIKGNQFEGVYRVRALAYRAILNGYESVRKDSLSLKSELKNNPQAVAYLRFFEWFQSSKLHAMLSFHSTAEAKLYLDNTYIGECKKAAILSTFPVVVTPGEHMLHAELTPRKGPSGGWFSLTLKTHTTNVISGMDWEYSTVRPEGWPVKDGPDDLWKSVVSGGRMLPLMSWWSFLPNAMVFTQSGKQLVSPWSGWDSSTKKTYLRKRFIQPGESAKGGASTIKNVDSQTESVRPEDDVSNEEL